VSFAYDAAGWQGDNFFYNGETGKTIRADVVYNLGNIPDEHFPHDRSSTSPSSHMRITNTPAFRKFCASKFAVYEYLREFFPNTILIKSEGDFYGAIGKLPGDYFVFKPNTGANGRGVKVLKKDEIALDNEMREIIAEPAGALLQEFVDASRGIAGICATHHDLRLATVNDVIALTHVRIPEPGGLIANYAQGATIRELAAADIPKNILTFYKKVHAKIAEKFPESPMYTMDIGVGADGEPLLFEINGTTAFPWPEFAGRDFFIENLAEHLGR
jgi:glutathione synthase/RimK-type ligase-like ATP-grasp enzyme